MKFIYLLYLLAWVASCRQPDPAPSEPDNATIVAGAYKLTKAIYMSRDVTDSYKETTLTVTRITANSVKADYKLKVAGSWNDTWLLSKVTRDTIKISASGTQQYENGKVAWANPVGGIYLWFEQVK